MWLICTLNANWVPAFAGTTSALGGCEVSSMKPIVSSHIPHNNDFVVFAT